MCCLRGLGLYNNCSYSFVIQIIITYHLSVGFYFNLDVASNQIILLEISQKKGGFTIFIDLSENLVWKAILLTLVIFTYSNETASRIALARLSVMPMLSTGCFC